MTNVNENILVGAGVTFAGMLLAGFVFLFRKLLDHLTARLACWRYLADVDLLIAKENVKIAHLQFGLRAPFLALPKDFDFPIKEQS